MFGNWSGPTNWLWIYFNYTAACFMSFQMSADSCRISSQQNNQTPGKDLKSLICWFSHRSINPGTDTHCGGHTAFLSTDFHYHWLAECSMPDSEKPFFQLWSRGRCREMEHSRRQSSNYILPTFHEWALSHSPFKIRLHLLQASEDLTLYVAAFKCPASTTTILKVQQQDQNSTLMLFSLELHN